jgi:hypothetical protein
VLHERTQMVVNLRNCQENQGNGWRCPQRNCGCIDSLF